MLATSRPFRPEVVHLGHDSGAMAIATAASEIDYTGNGATVAFATGFKFLANSDLVVKLAPEDGEFSTLVEGIDYTVTGANLDAGGTVTCLTAPETGDTLRITRTVPLTQPTSFRTQGSFSAAVHEKSFDRLTMQMQQVSRDVLASLADLAGTSLGAAFGFLTQQAPLTPSNVLQVRHRSNGTRLQISEHGGPWRSVLGGDDVRDLRDYGTDVGGGGDDTAAFQALLDEIGADTVTQEAKNGMVYIPGIIRASETLHYYGSNGFGARFFGDHGITQGTDSGSVIRWTGAEGGKLLHAHGAVGCSFERLRFDGNALAKDLLHFGERQAADGFTFSGSSTVMFRDCQFLGMVDDVDSVLFSAGEVSPGNLQASEYFFENCLFRGNPTAKGYGFKSLTGGNTKNFHFRLITFTNLRYPVYLGTGSGLIDLRFISFAGLGDTAAPATAVYAGSGNNVVIDGFAMENEGATAARLLETGNSCCAAVRNGYIGGVTPADDYVVIAGGPTKVENVSFEFPRRVGANVLKLQVEPTKGTLALENCFFQYNTTPLTHAPIYDGNGNHLLESDHGRATRHGVSVTGCKQNDNGGSDFDPLPDESGTPLFVTTGAFTETITEAGITIDQVTGTFRVTIPHTVWKAADLTQTITIGYAQQLSLIGAVIARTTTAYAGLAGTIQLEVGIDTDTDAFILAHDVKTGTVVKGVADADMGTLLTRANAVQGGYFVPSGVTRYMQVRLVSGTGNLGNGTVTNLSAGSTQLIFQYRPSPVY